jgi:hypothetical protein
MFNIEKDVYQYLGLCTMIIFVSYILIRTLRFQSKIFEGLTNSTTSTKPDISKENNGKLSDTINTNIKNVNIKMSEVLSLDKYKTNYENLIISLEEYSNTMMFAKIMSIGNKIGLLTKGDHINDDIIHEIDNANKLKSFIDTLNAGMKFIDNTKTSIPTINTNSLF